MTRLGITIRFCGRTADWTECNRAGKTAIRQCGASQTAPGPTTPPHPHYRSATASVSLDNLASRGDIPYEVSGRNIPNVCLLPLYLSRRIVRGSKVRHDSRRDRRRKRPKQWWFTNAANRPKAHASVKASVHQLLISMVGATGLEPVTSCV